MLTNAQHQTEGLLTMAERMSFPVDRIHFLLPVNKLT